MAKNTVQGGNPLEPIHGYDGLTTGEIIQSAVLVKEGTDLPLPSSTSLGLMVNPAGTFLQGARQTITTAGSPAPLNGGSTLICKAVMVVALPTNTQRVAIGNTNVDASDSTFNGIPLDPLQGIPIEVGNVANVWLDVLGDGHGVSWTMIA